MISKIPKKRKDDKSSFKSLIDYIAGDGYPPQRCVNAKKKSDDPHDAVYTGTRNTFSEKHWEIAEEMYSLGIMNTRCKDPVFHFVLSFREEETPSNSQIEEAMDIALKELRMENCKAIYSLHKNETGLYHIHACVCRVDPETHCAVNPGGGWAEKTLFKAARKIEVAQGWEILREDKFWDVTDDGRVVKKNRYTKQQDEKPKLSPKAQDIEAHTGEKSAQTIAIERGAGILREARSWQDLHEKLSFVGMEFRKKGSGAVIVVNGVLVKASDVGRDCSLSYIEKRIGEFYERNKSIGNNDASESNSPSFDHERNISLNENAAIERNRRAALGKAEPTDQVAAAPETLGSWKQYQIYKAEYRERKDKRDAIFARFKIEREALKKSHKTERDKLYRTNWKGRGAELNQQRRIVAAKQLQERLRLKIKHNEEKQELGNSEKFLSYRKWLAEYKPEHIKKLRNWKSNVEKTKGGEKNLSPDDITGVWTGEEQPPIGKISETNPIYRKQASISEAEEGENEFATFQYKLPSPQNVLSAKSAKKTTLGIESYQLTKGEKGENLFGLHGQEIAFIERDKEIELFKYDESAVLAALQLANNKWKNGIKVEGNDEYLELCMKLAEEHNLKIQVPKEYLKKREEKLREQAKPQQRDSNPLAGREIEDGSNGAYVYVSAEASRKAKRVIDAIPEKSYKGAVVGKEKGFILLQTGKNEITIVNEKSLSLDADINVGDSIRLEKQRPNAKRRDVTNINRDRGR